MYLWPFALVLALCFYLGSRHDSGSVVKESACSAGDASLIHRLGRSPGGGKATHSSILAWRTPWTEEPGGPKSVSVTKSQTWLSSWTYMHRRNTWSGATLLQPWGLKPNTKNGRQESQKQPCPWWFLQASVAILDCWPLDFLMCEKK